MNFPTRFGFESDLRACHGKTIERVEMIKMEYGCTWETAFALRFTDGTRAFFGATVGTGIMDPLLDGQTCGDVRSVETSDIFSKREYAQMVEARNQQAISRAKDEERHARRQFEALAARFGGVNSGD